MLGSVFDCGACPYLADRHFHIFVPQEDGNNTLHADYRALMDLGFRRNAIEFPVSTSKDPRKIPESPWYMRTPFVLMVAGGVCCCYCWLIDLWMR